MPTVPEQFRPSRKLLRAVADLHTRGYQRLRIVPYLYELGTWRCLIAPAAWISKKHGAELAEGQSWQDAAPYSNASGAEYWGWSDAHHCTPSRLAEVFLEKYRAIADMGYGQDWLYAGWYQHMLHVTYPDALPIAFSDQYLVDGQMWSIGREVRFALPPVGFSSAA